MRRNKTGERKRRHCNKLKKSLQQKVQGKNFTVSVNIIKIITGFLKIFRLTRTFRVTGNPLFVQSKQYYSGSADLIADWSV